MSPSHAHIERTIRLTADPVDHVPICTRTLVFAHLEAGHRRLLPHPEYARFVWTLNGSGTVTILDDQAAELRTSQFVLWLPGEGRQHLFASVDDWNVCWWVLDGPLVSHVLNGMGFGTSGVYDGKCPELELRRLRVAMRDFSFSGQARNGAATYGILARLAAGGGGEHPDDVVENAIQVIQNDLTNPDLTVQAVADAVAVDRFSLAKRFRRATGVPPIQYINSQRIDYATQLLSEGRYRIADIANRCGIRDPAYFSRLFKRLTGMTPREARAQE